jgi:hypothetical protein
MAKKENAEKSEKVLAHLPPWVRMEVSGTKRASRSNVVPSVTVE